MDKLYLLRHGESQANKDRIFAAKKIDPPLTEKGIEQIIMQSESLKNIKLSEIYASPLSRAKHSADIVNKYHNLDIITSSDLYEIDVGIIDGDDQNDPDKWEIYADIMNKWGLGLSHVSFPEGESLNDVRLRWESFLKNLDGTEGSVLIVGHCLLFMAFTWLFCENHERVLEKNYMGRGHITTISKDNDIFLIDEFDIKPGEFNP